MFAFNLYSINAEYFCNDCGQLRGSTTDKILCCGNCCSKNIIIDKPGKLDKTKLKKQFHNSTQ